MSTQLSQLASYYSASKGSGNSVYATFLVSGEVAIAPPPHSQDASSMDTSDTAEPGSPQTLERRIVLTGEDELDGEHHHFTTQTRSLTRLVYSDQIAICQHPLRPYL